MGARRGGEGEVWSEMRVLCTEPNSWQSVNIGTLALCCVCCVYGLRRLRLEDRSSAAMS